MKINLDGKLLSYAGDIYGDSHIISKVYENIKNHPNVSERLSDDSMLYYSSGISGLYMWRRNGATGNEFRWSFYYGNDSELKDMYLNKDLSIFSLGDSIGVGEYFVNAVSRRYDNGAMETLNTMELIDHLGNRRYYRIVDDMHISPLYDPMVEDASLTYNQISYDYHRHITFYVFYHRASGYTGTYIRYKISSEFRDGKYSIIVTCNGEDYVKSSVNSSEGLYMKRLGLVGNDYSIEAKNVYTDDPGKRRYDISEIVRYS